jgi:hypothetical protein
MAHACASAAVSAKIRRVGFLSPHSAADKDGGVANFEAFRTKLEELGYVEGKIFNLM